MNPVFEIINDGPLLRSTTYWQTDLAQRGLMLLSGNAGALRLLVPQAAIKEIEEMRTGRRVTIEKSINTDCKVDIVFEDGTNWPFSVFMREDQVINMGGRGRSVRLLVYSPAGLVLELPADIKV